MKQKHFKQKYLTSIICAVLFGNGWAVADSAATTATEGNNLISVYRQALLEDPQIERWQANLEASREARNQTEAKLLQPHVSLNANLTGNFQTIKLTGAAVGLGGYSQFVSGGYSINLTQPLFHYDRMIALDQAGQRIKLADIDMYAAHQDLLIRVAERYFGVLAALDNLHYATVQKNSFATQKEVVHKRFDAGELTIVDISEIDAGYDRAVTDEMDAERQLKSAKEALREVSGQDFTNLIPLTDEIPLATPEPNVESPWLEQALTQNPHIIAATLNTDIAKEEINRQSSAHLPTLDLVGGNNYLTTGGQFGEYEMRSNTVGIVMNMTIYEGNQASSREKEAAFRHSEAQAQLKQEQRSVQRQTVDAFNEVNTGISRIQSLKQTMASQVAAVNSIHAGIDAGIRTNLDLVLAEKELLRAQRDYAKARYDYLLYTLRLKRAAGVLAEKDLQHINGLLKTNNSEDRANL
jgi:outer membrane protein